MRQRGPSSDSWGGCFTHLFARTRRVCGHARRLRQTLPLRTESWKRRATGGGQHRLVIGRWMPGRRREWVGGCVRCKSSEGRRGTEENVRWRCMRSESTRERHRPFPPRPPAFPVRVCAAVQSARGGAHEQSERREAHSTAHARLHTARQVRVSRVGGEPRPAATPLRGASIRAVIGIDARCPSAVCYPCTRRGPLLACFSTGIAGMLTESSSPRIRTRAHRHPHGRAVERGLERGARGAASTLLRPL